MKYALITGANKGIGLEVVKILAKNDFHVFIGARDKEKGAAASKQLAHEGITNVEPISLEVADQSSIDNALKIIRQKTNVLDVLVNNAGISGGFPQSALNATAEQFRSVFETNVFGVAMVTQAFVDLLKKSDAPRIVNVTSAMGSLTLAADVDSPGYANKMAVYQSSKAALNMYTINLAYELRDTNFKVNAVCPGWTRTDFTAGQGTSSPQEAGARIAKYALIGNHGPSGKYISEEYFPEPASCPW